MNAGPESGGSKPVVGIDTREQVRRWLWTSVLNKMEDSRGRFEHIPYFAMYGKQTPEADQRVFVLRSVLSPKYLGSFSRLVALTADGPFTLFIPPRLGDGRVFDSKLATDAEKPFNDGGYVIVKDFSQTTRTITLGDDPFTFTWTHKKKHEIQVAYGDEVDGAVSLARPLGDNEDREELKHLLLGAVQETGIPAATRVVMWD